MATDLLATAVQRLNNGGKLSHKTINDSVWGVVELMPWEVLLLDTPLLQRLRGIHQLGMAHLVYPGATHTRLEHTIGVLEASERIYRRLQRSVENWNHFRPKGAKAIPAPHENDQKVVRLAALLHDVGHGPYSHISEEFIACRHPKEFTRAHELLRGHFDGAPRIKPAEMISALLVLSQPMKDVLRSSGFDGCVAGWDMPNEIAAKILGASAPDIQVQEYLSGVVSGPLDADKLDYMARDSHHTGLPVGIDVDRLISKLQVVEVNEQNAPNDDLLQRVQQLAGKRYHDIGISMAGVAAFEQMIIARVILFDRLYHHHKIRAAESQLIEFLKASEKDRGSPIPLSDLLGRLTDEGVILMLNRPSRQTVEDKEETASRRLFLSLTNRDIHHRAFVFAPRFIAGLEGLPYKDREELRGESWTKLINTLKLESGREDLAREIREIAIKLAVVLPCFSGLQDRLSPDSVLVDLPEHKAVVQQDVLFANADGSLNAPNMYFDADRWSKAYASQKHCCYIFCPRELKEVVAAAARIVLYARFGMVMSSEAHRICKLEPSRLAAVIRDAEQHGLCQQGLAEAIAAPRPSLASIETEHLCFPPKFLEEDPRFASELVSELRRAIPSGLLPSVRDSLAAALGHMAAFLWSEAQSCGFRQVTELKERDLQDRVRELLRDRGVAIQEGSAIAGGETDIVFPGDIILENKSSTKTTVEDPFLGREKFGWQARRYARALGRNLFLVLFAYKPASEAAILPLPRSVRVMPSVPGMEDYVEVRFAVPFGYPVPSKAGLKSQGKR